MGKHQNIKIIKDAIKPETPEVLAASLIAIADAYEALRQEGGITDAGLIALLRAMPGMSRISGTDILLVLENIGKLKSYYVRSAPKK